MNLSLPLQLSPEYREYVWGGQRLRPGRRTAEAWVIYEGDRIAAGPLAGRTLAEVAAEDPIGLLGRDAVAHTGPRFPLLIKLMDVAQWLSLQVHPDDALAAALEGPGQFGKTEAWHVLDAEPGARFIGGVRPGTTAAALADAIRRGAILDLVRYRRARPGDTIFMPARTVHALGPGLLIYEVQQTSDLTYRVFDWDRPASPDRPLHIEKSLAAADPSAAARVRRARPLAGSQRVKLAASPYFTLELIAEQARPVGLNTAQRAFDALTVIDGAAEVVVGEAAGQVVLTLGRFESVVVPAACGRYMLRPLGACRVLKASIGQGQ